MKSIASRSAKSKLKASHILLLFTAFWVWPAKTTSGISWVQTRRISGFLSILTKCQLTKETKVVNYFERPSQFWNRRPKEAVTLIQPYNLDHTNDHRWAAAMYRIDFSGAGELGYDRHMEVSIADLPDVEPLLAPFAMDGMKMFAGKDGDVVDVFGNSSHPNAKFLTENVGYNWAFVASGSMEEDIAVVELGLPLSTVDSDDRVVLLERNSIYNVLYNEVMTIWPNSSEEILNAWLANTEAPGFFNHNGFIQGGEAPGDKYLPLVRRIEELTPYNPNAIANLEISFN